MAVRSLCLPLPEQRAIAHILGTLDDKIELNRRMNATLEEMARALFKSWFVDFDPVRAKAEGRDTGLPREIADLFPDGFEESAVGEVPKGWRVAALGRDCSSMSDTQPSTIEQRIGRSFSTLTALPTCDALTRPELKTDE